MVYRPGGFPARNLAQSSAPRTKPSRLRARWLNSMVSPGKPKTTVCSPGQSAIRRAWIEISPVWAGFRVRRHQNEPVGSIPLAGALGQTQGRSARSVFLGLVMAFDDRDVGGRAQRPGRLTHEFHEQIDSPAHVRRRSGAGSGGRRLERGPLFGAQACRANNQGNFRATQHSVMAGHRRRQREVDHHIDVAAAEATAESKTPVAATPARVPASRPISGWPSRDQGRGQRRARGPRR